LYTTKKLKDNHINLFLITETNEHNVVNSHYTYIKKFNGLMYDITNDHNKKYFCVKCLLFFRSEEALKNHYDNYPECFNNTPCKCVLPDKGKNFIEFKNYKN